MDNTDRIIVCRWISPAGELALGSIGESVCLCDWTVSPDRLVAPAPESLSRVPFVRGSVIGRLCRLLAAEPEQGASPVIDMLRLRLEEYFAGARKLFDLPVLMVGTDFQRRVWSALTSIPYGTTISYTQLADRVGCRNAVRAVAAANAANAMSIIVPCHRVNGSDGRLVGYSGGLHAKRFLLDLERSHTPGTQLSLFDDI